MVLIDRELNNAIDIALTNGKAMLTMTKLIYFVIQSPMAAVFKKKD